MSAWLNTAAAVVVVAFASAVMVSAAPPPATSAPGLSPAHVLVINGAAQPMPVAPQGTTIVGGSVAATQSGTWNVGVAGTADVRVTNASPLPVTLQGGEAAAQLVMNAAAASFTSGESTVVLYRVPAGKRLATAGHVGREMFIIVNGEATVRTRQKRAIRLGPGDFVGEMSLIDGGLRSADVEAATPMRLLVVSFRDFWSLLEAAPALSRKIMQTLSRRLREAERGVSA